VLTLEGASGAAAEAWGGRVWAGQLTVGLAVLLLVVLVVSIMGRRVQSVARKRSIARYEERERKQRATFGHTAADYARANNGRSSNG
jgi:Tfp pilus assembly protein PilO